MKTQHPRVYSVFAFFLAILFLPLAARANVYATNIKINGGITNLVSLLGGESVVVSYILNEAASGGVTIEVLATNGVVRTISIPAGNPGALRGTNAVTWDSRNDAGEVVGTGSYQVKITAAAAGYDGWTQISDDNNPANYVYEMRGIAVNKNTNSPYYGRIFAGNCFDNTAFGGTEPGDNLGILKWNADGSRADEGVFSDGG